MQLNLQPLGVDVGEDEAHRAPATHDAHPAVRLQPAAEGAPRDHEGADCADKPQEQRRVAAYAVDDERFVPDGRRELEDGQEGGGQEAAEVEQDAGFVPEEGCVVCTRVSWR